MLEIESVQVVGLIGFAARPETTFGVTQRFICLFS
jgi:hypothetical protein